MTVNRRAGVARAAALLACAAAVQAAPPALDPYTGLRMQGDWELVRNHCIACHSTKLITQQRGTAALWLAMIRWMQATQNLRTFEPDVERRIVAYLAENYPPETSRRRAPLPAALMPPNPYAAPGTPDD